MHIDGVGYQAPENLQNYAAYLDSRIHAYRDLKHDAIRVQSDSNRDARTTAAVNGYVSVISGLFVFGIWFLNLWATETVSSLCIRIFILSRDHTCDMQAS